MVGGTRSVRGSQLGGRQQARVSIASSAKPPSVWSGDCSAGWKTVLEKMTAIIGYSTPMYVSEPSDLISECKLDAKDSDGNWDSAARWRLPPRLALCQ